MANCEDEALLARWRPSTGGCRVLTTARRSNWTPVLGVTVLPLNVLSSEQSVELLSKYRPELDGDDPALRSQSAVLGPA